MEAHRSRVTLRIPKRELKDNVSVYKFSQYYENPEKGVERDRGGRGGGDRQRGIPKRELKELRESEEFKTE